MKKERILTTAVFLLGLGSTMYAADTKSGSDASVNGQKETAKPLELKNNSVQQAQSNIKVSGIVYDNLNEPIIGATVRVKGTQIAAVTDLVSMRHNMVHW